MKLIVEKICLLTTQTMFIHVPNHRPAGKGIVTSYGKDVLRVAEVAERTQRSNDKEHK